MPAPNRLAVGGFDRQRVARVILLLFSLGWVTLAAYAFWKLLTDDRRGLLLAPSALVLLGCGTALATLLVKGKRRGQAAGFEVRLVEWAIWRRLFVGAVSTYIVALAIGPLPHLGWVWLATIATWQSLLLLPIATSPRVAESWRRWTQGRSPRRLAWLAYAAALLLIASEAALRAQRIVSEASWLSPVPAESDVESSPSTADRQPLLFPLERFQAGRFRVALISQPSDAGKLMQRVQQTLPGAEIVSLPIALDDNDLRIRDVRAEVEARGVDLVLVVLPVCENLAREVATPSVFDWRAWELASLVLDGTPQESAKPRSETRDFESYLGEVETHLAACRTPLSESMQVRWQRTYAAIDRTIAGCRQADVPLALVVVPGEFQLNPGLRDTLLRRGGVSPDQFDAELPQRRIAGFAQQRRLPVVDLLPHLRLCRDTVYERHTTMLNAQGNQAAASAIGGWLASRYGDRLAAQLSKAP